MGEMWKLKQGLGNLLKFMKKGAILGRYSNSVVLAMCMWGGTYIYVHTYV